jgi:mannonate dehydratase
VKIALLLSGYQNEKWILARQIGVRYAVAKLAPELTGMAPPWDFDTLLRYKTAYTDSEMNLAALEGDQFDLTRIKLGLPGRDEDIDRYRRMIRNMARLGVELICQNFMAGFGWMRTSTTVPGRGNALYSAFDHRYLTDAPATEHGTVSEDRMWDNIAYFLKAVVPVAESEGIKIAIHPDDPPVSPLRGISRILTSMAAYRRLFELAPSPALGATFCQATFSLMEDVDDVAKAASELAAADKLHFVHIRQVRGDRHDFVEQFHDQGPVDLAAMLRTYHEVGFDGMIRPDHTPTMYGEAHFDPTKGGLSTGYEMQGRLFAVGYLKGLLEAQGIPVE